MSLYPRIHALLLAPLFLCALPFDSAQAQNTPAAQTGTRLNLDVAVRSKVANDEMQATFAVEKDGTDLGKVNEQVLQMLNAALDDIKKSPTIRGRLDSVYTNPNYNAQGKPTGWRVRGEVSMRSLDFPAMANLTGQLASRLQMAGIQFTLSDTARQKAEKQLLNEAASAFKLKATNATAAFGFTKYRLVELNLGNSSNVIVRPMAANVRGKLGDASAMNAAPVEGGDSEVILTVSGFIEMQ
jgi:predicted secreted protein